MELSMKNITEKLKSDNYQTRQVCRLVGLQDRQVRHWTDMKLVVPDVQPSQGRHGVRRIYSYRNLIEFAIIKRLVERGYSLIKVEDILTKVKENGYFENNEKFKILIDDDGRVELLTEKEVDEKDKSLFHRSLREYLTGYKPGMPTLLRHAAKRMKETGEDAATILEKVKSFEIDREYIAEEVQRDPKFQIALREVKVDFYYWLFSKAFTDQGVYVLPVHTIGYEIVKRA